MDITRRKAEITKSHKLEYNLSYLARIEFILYIQSLYLNFGALKLYDKFY